MPRDIARRFAQEMEQGGAAPSAGGVDSAMALLAEAWRHRGHLEARLDPLGRASPARVAELDPAFYGLPPGSEAALRAVYGGSIGWEFSYIHDRARRDWLQAQAEAPAAPDSRIQRDLLALLKRGQAFEETLQGRLPGAKLFGLAGGDGFLVAVETIFRASLRAGVEEVVMGGMHRGRFALLAVLLEKPLVPLIAEITGKSPLPQGMQASSDVPYHLGYSGEREIDGKRLRLTVSPHPSHLQVIGVVAQGRTRGKQALRGEDGKRQVLPLLLHTDASFAGQGIVAELFQLSKVAPFDLGGTIHVIINNQLGFTTLPEEGRSARYCTDIAKLVEAPVLHVNGDDVEALYHAASVAAAYRTRFGSDILLDIVCYRRHGHNEIDEPRFTQPAMYRAIDERPPLAALYQASLAQRGVDTAPGEQAAADMTAAVKAAFDGAAGFEVNDAGSFHGIWQGFRSGSAADMLAFTETGLPIDTLKAIGRSLTTAPDGFTLDRKVARFLDQRRESIETGQGIDWATGEAMGFASLLAEGTPLRFGGQDSLRGAFTQRHLFIHDSASEKRHCVLDPLAQQGGALCEVFNTPLIEYAVLAYEYGCSLTDPRRLIVWEAQFGDFLNIAQAIFDQFVAGGEDRWLRSSGLTILLPHGLDGGGPDHSTGHPERLLAACAQGNIQIANVSTPANFFHLLRRQMRRDFRKPLVVLTPKALLRQKACVSALAEFGPGTGFQPLIPDSAAQKAQRLILCTGKIYYELAAERAARGLESQVALARIEQLYPLPEEGLRALFAAHAGADLVWCQEEPANMGYFTHLDRPLEALSGRTLRCVSRPAVPSPATGLKYGHEAERKAVLDAALSGLD
ncbi:MAG: 2-oxoglutarate dehydrogenase E1 component [Alphaproteobacteria bacterium]|nr:2-oxoglutarate dehydrogenase E1 component [Alphaproteobacteria bacterium]MBU0798186.1 2-oxoglutarate dehydrogenase E1 component [Alphaproteobacteria bacterium]MBU0887596.1 2-oxoglutarate dehydrogenase E1 component [Alphaproteobacteria bacterium]MBU1814247.1 2-oxoglutarate dehydrogenase E1 component [Alphaproteobacteria bacterium]